MQAPDFTTSAFRSSMLQRPSSLHDNNDEVLHLTDAEQLSAVTSAPLTTRQQQQFYNNSITIQYR